MPDEVGAERLARRLRDGGSGVEILPVVGAGRHVQGSEVLSLHDPPRGVVAGRCRVDGRLLDRDQHPLVVYAAQLVGIGGEDAAGKPLRTKSARWRRGESNPQLGLAKPACSR